MKASTLTHTQAHAHRRGPSHTPFGGVRHLASTYGQCRADRQRPTQSTTINYTPITHPHVWTLALVGPRQPSGVGVCLCERHASGAQTHLACDSGCG
eukprot:scaffold15689_cov135-Isochrysis_galbana.AAC.3